MSSHEYLLQAQFYLTLARNYEREGLPESARIAREISGKLMELADQSKGKL